MTLTARLSASGRRLVAHFSGGSELTLQRVTAGELQDDASVSTSTASATISCSYPTPYGQALRDGERVLDGDLRTLVWSDDPKLTFAPRAEDVVTLDGETYTVVAVSKTLGAYELHLRGGGG